MDWQIIKTPVFRISSISGVVLILYLKFQWDVVEVVTPFIAVFIEAPVVLFFFFAFLYSVWFPFSAHKKYHAWSILPLAINICVLLIIALVPLTEMTIDSDFSRKLNYRIRVIEQIQSGELTNNVDYNSSLIKLPLGYPSLSKGGNDIVIERDSEGQLNVLFFTYRGVVDNFAGFIYKESKTPPTADDFTCGTMLNSKTYTDSWYWISCT